MEYTKIEVYKIFRILCKNLSKRIDDAEWKALFLDYKVDDGGYVIEQQEENGGIYHPFGSRRRTSKEMCLSMLMAIQALEMISEEY